MTAGKESFQSPHGAAGDFEDDISSLDPTTGVWKEVIIAVNDGPGAEDGSELKVVLNQRFLRSV